MSDPVNKIETAGHEEQQPERKYTEPSSQLKSAFEKWHSKWYGGFDGPCLYHSSAGHYDALKLIQTVKPSIEEGHGLLMSGIDENLSIFGPFLAAIYNSVPEKHVIFDLELDQKIPFMGVNLAKDKVLVNKGTIGDHALYMSDATLINNGTVGYDYGIGNGQIINYGRVNSIDRTSNLLIMNMGEITSNIKCEELAHCTKVINFKPKWGHDYVAFCNLIEYSGLGVGIKLFKEHYHTIPEFGNYMTALEKKFELGRKDYTKALEALAEFGPRPDREIFLDIYRILQRAGHNV